MAKIIKVASHTNTPRIANQFRTSRNSTTNPFKYQDFEGNTLDISAFADVFESSAVKESGKMRLIAASVAGTMHKITTGITEPIRRFVGRIHENISSAWNYAKNTNVSDLEAVKSISSGLKEVSDFMNKPLELPGSRAIDSVIGAINGNISEWGKDISSKWNALISKIHSSNKISADMSVAELEELWKSEIASVSLEEVA